MPEPLYIGIDAESPEVEIAILRGSVSSTCSALEGYAEHNGIKGHADAFAALIAETVPPPEHGNVEGICIGVPSAARFQKKDFTQYFRSALGPAFSSCTLVVEDHSLVTLDAAFQDMSGMTVVAGIGSAVVARTEENDVLRAGDWGLRIGDEGSASAIGTAALRAIAADFDGGEPTVLRRQFAEQYGDDSPVALSGRVHADEWKVESLTPLVIAAAESGDWVCTRILKTQANALAQRAGWVATRAPAPITPRIALAGSLADEAYYRLCLSEALVRHLPTWRIFRSAHRPVHGALARAQQCALAPDSGD